MESKFSIFKKLLNNQFKKIGSAYQPKSFDRLASIQYNNTKRLPSYLKEPFFANLFKVNDIIDKFGIDLKNETLKLRNETVETLRTPAPKLKLRNSLLNATMRQMSVCLDLPGRLAPVDIFSVFNELPGKTSSGIPDHITPKRDNIKHIHDQIKYFISTKDFSWIHYPTYVSWRTQVRPGPKVKFRQFFPLPQFIQNIEAVFILPFLHHFEVRKNTSYCFGNVYTDLRVRNHYWNTKKYIYSLDLKGYDTSISNELLDIAFKFIRSKLYIKDSLWNETFKHIVHYHKFCKIITSYNNESVIISKTKGLMSGSVGTNFIGTLINLFCAVYFCLDHGIPFTKHTFSIMSDDIIIAIDEYYTISYIADYYKKHFGLTISIEKSEIFKPFDKIFFLGHYMDINGRYLDWDLTKLQLSVSEEFIPEEVMSKSLRLTSKLCSMCIKCSDGYEFFKKYQDHLKTELNVDELPKYFIRLFFSQSVKEQLNVEHIFTDTWMRC